MTLLELCEPLFQYICRLNRAGRIGSGVDFVTVRSETKTLLEQMRAKGAADFKLNKQCQAVELPLIFFIDSMIAESKLPCASEWHRNRLAYEKKELAGDEKFFDELEDTLKEPGDDATERLAIFYICMGLGFTGWYQGQPEYLRKKMLEISSRIRPLLESDSNAKICPENYQGIDTRTLTEPPAGRIWLMVVLFVISTGIALACNLSLFQKAYGTLNESLTEILRQERNLGQ